MSGVSDQDQMVSRIPGFYNLSQQERRRVLAERFHLSETDLNSFNCFGGLQPETAEHMVENTLGVLGLPVGVALNFVINGEPTLVPMAVEEPSVIAACSHIAGLAAESGGFTVDTDPSVTVGQIQLVGVRDVETTLASIASKKDELLREGNRLCPGLVGRGGGCIDLEVRHLPQLETGPHAELDDGGSMVVVHVVIDCLDAMGANAVNTVVEGLAPQVESCSDGQARLRILSNLADRRCARASMRIRFEDLARKADPDQRESQGRETARRIVDAYRFAARDPYRACTHNKGIMNGVDAVAIATGNDWRAIEAGAHAFAARSGQYTSLSRFWVDEENGYLHGQIELPMAVGTVGGATQIHPTIAACRKILGPFAKRANTLAGLMAAVGLSQNCGALKALATEGIQRGHMTLHARQVALAAGATDDEVAQVAQALIKEQAIGPANARKILKRIRPEGDATQERCL